MLFDLRGKGRRRAVQAIYLTLALLMGGGLIFFGIGGATNGGLFDAIGKNGSTSVSALSKKELAHAERVVRANRKDPKAWTALARIRITRATTGYNQSTGQFDDAGKAELAEASRAWQNALDLTKKPDPNVAVLMVQAYGQGALSKPDLAVEAFEVTLATQKPTSELYQQYAQLAYIASQNRKGDLAAARPSNSPRGRSARTSSSSSTRSRRSCSPSRCRTARRRPPPRRRCRRADPPPAWGRGRTSAAILLGPRPCSSIGRAADS